MCDSYRWAQWRIPNGIHVEFWYDFTGGGKGPWIKYASLDDTLPGHCNGGSITGPIGLDGTLIGPAPAQDSMRLNGADATYITGSIVELTAGQSPKGSMAVRGIMQITLLTLFTCDPPQCCYL
jgi:hypothetical protein